MSEPFKQADESWYREQYASLDDLQANGFDKTTIPTPEQVEKELRGYYQYDFTYRKAVHAFYELYPGYKSLLDDDYLKPIWTKIISGKVDDEKANTATNHYLRWNIGFP